jgi:hypothetical protein
VVKVQKNVQPSRGVSTTPAGIPQRSSHPISMTISTNHNFLPTTSLGRVTPAVIDILRHASAISLWSHLRRAPYMHGAPRTQGFVATSGPFNRRPTNAGWITSDNSFIRGQFNVRPSGTSKGRCDSSPFSARLLADASTASIPQVSGSRKYQR